jgi:hypothetical protein
MQTRTGDPRQRSKSGSSVSVCTGERSAVGSNAGPSVDHSDPGLRRPTSPATAGRKPAARPPLSQRKSGQGFGDGVPDIESQREALGSLSPSGGREAGALDAFSVASVDDYSVRQLLEFFEILDRWDREAHGTQTM